MKLAYYIFFILSGFYAVAQKDPIIIKGVVTNIESKKSIKNALVHLVSSQGHSYEYKTDSTGAYRFYVNSESAFSCTVTIASDKWTTSGSFRNLGFLASKDQAIFELYPGKVYEKNFELKEIIGCEPYIHLLFYTNSSLSCNDSLNRINSTIYERLDSTISFLSYLLKDSPTMTIELLGHASKIEKNPAQLSIQRVECIRQLLIDKGINPKRVEIKGFGINKLLVTDNQIKKATTKEEKMALHAKNQRVFFRIISWDFAEEKK